MHSHVGLQEQRLLAAPLIVRDPAEAGLDEQEVVVLLHNFTSGIPRKSWHSLDKAAAQQEHEGWAYFFCSNACHELCLAAPERYSSSRRQVSPAQVDKEP